MCAVVESREYEGLDVPKKSLSRVVGTYTRVRAAVRLVARSSIDYSRENPNYSSRRLDGTCTCAVVEPLVRNFLARSRTPN